MGGHAKDEESAREAAVAMGWFDEHRLWTPENPAPPELAALIGLQQAPTRDPKWESVKGRIDSHDDGSKAVTLEVRPEGHVVGYRIDVGRLDVPRLPRLIDKMVKQIDEALDART